MTFDLRTPQDKKNWRALFTFSTNTHHFPFLDQIAVCAFFRVESWLKSPDFSIYSSLTDVETFRLAGCLLIPFTFSVFSLQKNCSRSFQPVAILNIAFIIPCPAKEPAIRRIRVILMVSTVQCDQRRTLFLNYFDTKGVRANLSNYRRLQFHKPLFFEGSSAYASNSDP